MDTIFVALVGRLILFGNVSPSGIVPAKFIGEMNINTCPSPRESCCPGYNVSTINGISSCVNATTGTIETPPMNETPLPNDTYCPPSGVGIWGEWTNWSDCLATCQNPGTKKRSRICHSESYGCTCYESDVGPCQTSPCPENCILFNGKATSTTSYDGKSTYYYPFGESAPNGLWSEWAYVFPPQCNDTCGMYGVGPSTRGCFPSGSICLGTVRTSIQRCPIYPVCFYNPSMGYYEACKAPYTKGVFEYEGINRFGCENNS